MFISLVKDIADLITDKRIAVSQAAAVSFCLLELNVPSCGV